MGYLDDLLLSLRQFDPKEKFFLPDIKEKQSENLVWLTPVNQNAYECEYIEKIATGWSRKKRQYDADGWRLEENGLEKKHRWSNLHTGKIVYNDPKDNPLDFWIIMAICKKEICRLKKIESMEMLPHYPWAAVLFLFSLGCSEVEIKGQDLIDLLRKLLEQRPFPVPIFFDELPREVLLKELSVNFSHRNIEKKISNGDLALILENCYSKILPKNGLHRINLLSRLSEPALVLLASSMGINSFWSTTACSKISLMRDITNEMLGIAE
jgi:hypothetical protein